MDHFKTRASPLGPVTADPVKVPPKSDGRVAFGHCLVAHLGIGISNRVVGDLILSSNQKLKNVG